MNKKRFKFGKMFLLGAFVFGLVISLFRNVPIAKAEELPAEGYGTIVAKLTVDDTIKWYGQTVEFFRVVNGQNQKFAKVQTDENGLITLRNIPVAADGEYFNYGIESNGVSGTAPLLLKPNETIEFKYNRSGNSLGITWSVKDSIKIEDVVGKKVNIVFKSNKVPLVGESITIENTDISEITDADGKATFDLSELPSGEIEFASEVNSEHFAGGVAGKTHWFLPHLLPYENYEYTYIIDFDDPEAWGRTENGEKTDKIEVPDTGIFGGVFDKIKTLPILATLTVATGIVVAVIFNSKNKTKKINKIKK
jgi:hypothetical protein